MAIRVTLPFAALLVAHFECAGAQLAGSIVSRSLLVSLCLCGVGGAVRDVSRAACHGREAECLIALAFMTPGTSASATPFARRTLSQIQLNPADYNYYAGQHFAGPRKIFRVRQPNS